MSAGSTDASIAEPASQHALALPEVLSAIFSHIDDDEFDPAAGILCDRAAILSRCCRVNRLWYAEASRQLAEEHALRGVIDPFDPEHLSALAEIRDEPPGQRQRHANLLKLVTLSNIRDPASASAPEDPTYSLAFPRVKALHLRLDDHLAANGQGWHIPPLGPSRIELLELDPRYERNPEAFGLTPNDWEDILEQIPDMFPYLQVIAFIDASQMYEDTLLQLRQRMPSLKEEGCLFGYVRFVSRDTYRTYH